MMEIVSEETLPDGRTVLEFDNGGKFTYPPIPDDEWRERTARELCENQYAARRRRSGAFAIEES